MSKQALIYARVSTADGKQDYTRQTTELEALALKHGYKQKDIQTFAESVSGYKTEERLELKAMLELCEKSPTSIGCIYTSEISRIGRNPTQTRTILDKLTDLGIPVYIQSLGQYTLENGKRNMTMNIILQVLLEYANLESETFKLRSKSGLLKSAKSGKAGGGATIPFGYTKDAAGMMVLDMNEVEAVRLIYNTYANGAGTKVLAGILNARGIKTKYQRIMEGNRVIKGGVKAVKNIEWSDVQVYSIITNPLYKGQRQFKGETIQAPAIVTPELWDKCNSIREGKAHRNYLTTYTYLLKDLCTCGKCERNYFAKYKPIEGGDKVYICSSRLKKGGNCGNLGVNINLIESAIYHYLVHNSEKLINIKSLETLKAQLWSKIKNLTDKANVDTRLLKSKHNEKARLLDIYVSGSIDKVTFNEKNERITTEAKNIRTRLEVVERDVKETHEAFKKLDAKNTSAKMLTSAKANRNELASLYKEILEKVVIDTPEKDRAVISLKLSLVNKPIQIELDLLGVKRKPMKYQYRVGNSASWIEIKEKDLIQI